MSKYFYHNQANIIDVAFGFIVVILAVLTPIGLTTPGIYLYADIQDIYLFYIPASVTLPLLITLIPDWCAVI